MATTATVIRITAMVTATPLTAMATRLMAMVMGPAITEVTDTPIALLSAAISTPFTPLSAATGATKEPTRASLFVVMPNGATVSLKNWSS